MSGDGSTPTPWRLNAGNEIQIMGATQSTVCRAECGGMSGIKLAEAEANARRIVAAVNATADIPVEALEAGVIAQILEAAGLMWETLTYVSEASECQASREAAAETMRDVSPALALAKGEAA